jgi:7-cyano-7-deazaguanine synthase in queuosine biosynthesis
MPDLPLAIPTRCSVPPAWPPPEDWWELVVVVLSNGKDSRVVLHDALDRYPRRRIMALYNHLGNEHEGSEAEAAALCRALEVPLGYGRCQTIGHSSSTTGMALSIPDDD